MTTTTSAKTAVSLPASGMTLGDLIRLPRASSAVRDLLLILGGVALTALAARVAFTMPWSAVPYTLQTGAVLFVGVTLGARRGFASMALYVLVGAFGLPVFVGGASGIGQLLGITGGYLAGFVLAALTVGWLAQRGWDRSVPRAAGLMLAGTLLIYAVGVPVLAFATGMDPLTAIYRGAGVFLPWDLAKVLLAAGALPLAWRLLGRG